MTEVLGKQESIHPRVVNGRTVHEKVNTSKKRSKGTVERKMAAINKHLEVHPRDADSMKHLDLLKSRL